MWGLVLHKHLKVRLCFDREELRQPTLITEVEREDHSFSACFAARIYWRFFSGNKEEINHWKRGFLKSCKKFPQFQHLNWDTQEEFHWKLWDGRGKSYQSLHYFIFFTARWDSQPQNILLCNAGTTTENNHAECCKGLFSSYYYRLT